jgi:hypothetical protein
MYRPEASRNSEVQIYSYRHLILGKVATYLVIFSIAGTFDFVLPLRISHSFIIIVIVIVVIIIIVLTLLAVVVLLIFGLLHSLYDTFAAALKSYFSTRKHTIIYQLNGNWSTLSKN